MNCIMLIEFTGPSASGKTVISKIIINQNDNVFALKPFLVELKKHPFLDYLYTLGLLVINLPYFLKAFLNVVINRKIFASYNQTPILKRAAYMGIKYALQVGAKGGTKVFLMDQGMFQLGSWASLEAQKDPVAYYHYFKQMICFPNILIMFSIPPELSRMRLEIRGDRLFEMNAKKRGFSSFKDLCQFEKIYEEQRINLALKAKTYVMVVRIKSNGRIGFIDYYSPFYNKNTEITAIKRYLVIIENCLKNFWISN